MITANRTPAFKKTLTPKDCENIYGLNPGTLANMRFHKIGPRYYKLGKKVLYRAEDIESWLARNVVLTNDDKD
jgi:hypothetical protein